MSREADSRPSSIVVSDADSGAVGCGFESRERHGSLSCNPSLLCDDRNLFTTAPGKMIKAIRVNSRRSFDKYNQVPLSGLSSRWSHDKDKDVYSIEFKTDTK
ncbi:hypothetical protein TNCV_3609871 [Trichonephila clavipes]|nr:hypothetical protein TNCV_3609871 [Trichonephila clavipes]